jgi:hypothetical protein
MRWQYLLSIFLLILASFIFLTLALFHTDTATYYPGGDLDGEPTVGYSWIWYHPEHWVICYGLNFLALVFFLYGLVLDFRESSFKLSNHLKVEIIEDEEEM